MKNLTIKQWTRICKKVQEKHGLTQSYMCVNIQYREHTAHGWVPFVEYGIYFSELGIATEWDQDWKKCIRIIEAQILLYKSRKQD